MNFPLPIYQEKITNGAGRQRKKSGTDESDGVKQMFELWFDEGGKLTFSEFFKNDLSVSMIYYYIKHYIKEDGKSHAEYTRWKRDFDRAKREARRAKAGVEGSKIIPLRGERA